MNELVSVAVLTYNSREFVLDTLESIFNQTYKDIELIVSDDASKDDTISIVRSWCETNRVKERFIDLKIITVPINTGIPSNYNRCINTASGEWIKTIAGDDALMPNCIEDNLYHISKDRSIKVLFSYLRIYKNSFKESNFSRISPGTFPSNIITPEITAQEQYSKLLDGDKIPFTPSLFLNRKALLSAGLPKEHLFSEDYQTKLNLTRSGFKLHFFEKETVLYRQHENATNNTIQDYILKPHYFKTENFRREYIYPNVPIVVKLWHQFNWVVNQIFRVEPLNRKNKFSSFIHYFLTSILNPFKYILFFQDNFIKKGLSSIKLK